MRGTTFGCYVPSWTLAAHRDSNAELVYCPVGHGQFSKLSATDDSLPFAGLALAMKPPLVVFVVRQRCFIQGLTQGALRD
jgi:ABC-type glycerol-3-phosphate transport system permease component